MMINSRIVTIFILAAMAAVTKVDVASARLTGNGQTLARNDERELKADKTEKKKDTSKNTDKNSSGGSTTTNPKPSNPSKNGGGGGGGDRSGANGFNASCSGGVNCAVSANRGGTDRAAGGYETINDRGVFERVPCRSFYSSLVKDARNFPGAASDCLVPNGCTAYGACCRVTRTLVCDVGNRITTPPVSLKHFWQYQNDGINTA